MESVVLYGWFHLRLSSSIAWHVLYRPYKIPKYNLQQIYFINHLVLQSDVAKTSCLMSDDSDDDLLQAVGLSFSHRNKKRKEDQLLNILDYSVEEDLQRRQRQVRPRPLVWAPLFGGLPTGTTRPWAAR